MAARAPIEKVTGIAAYISFGAAGPAIEAFSGKVGRDPDAGPVTNLTSGISNFSETEWMSRAWANEPMRAFTLKELADAAYPSATNHLPVTKGYRSLPASTQTQVTICCQSTSGFHAGCSSLQIQRPGARSMTSTLGNIRSVMGLG